MEFVVLGASAIGGVVGVRRLQADRKPLIAGRVGQGYDFQIDLIEDRCSVAAWVVALGVR